METLTAALLSLLLITASPDGDQKQETETTDKPIRTMVAELPSADDGRGLSPGRQHTDINTRG